MLFDKKKIKIKNKTPTKTRPSLHERTFKLSATVNWKSIFNFA